MWETIAAIGVIAVIIAGAVIKIVREKKKGVQCIGCPAAQQCARNREAGCSGCPYAGDTES